MRIRDWSSDVCSSDLDAGVDLSYHNKDDWTTETTYFEKACFKPIPMQENGQQVLWGLHYSMTAWRHGEEAMDPFHDEVGFLLWDKAHGEVMRSVVFGRGIAILAGSSAGPHDKVLRFRSDERRVGNEWVRTCRYRWRPY